MAGKEREEAASLAYREIAELSRELVARLQGVTELDLSHNHFSYPDNAWKWAVHMGGVSFHGPPHRANVHVQGALCHSITHCVCVCVWDSCIVGLIQILVRIIYILLGFLRSRINNKKVKCRLERDIYTGG